MEIPKWIPKKIAQESEDLGGMDTDDSEDLQEKTSCDKGSHRERSLFNQPNHSKHWKKEEHETKQEIQSE